MIFIKAFLLFIIVLAILFIVVCTHVLLAFSVYSIIKYKISGKKNSFLYIWKNINTNILRFILILFISIHFFFFIGLYRHYINDETNYHEAKIYYVVGEVANVYSVYLGRTLSPLNPLVYGITKPTNFIKKYLFEKGSKLIPDTDGEKELWEYEWFYYPYAVRFSDMFDSYHYGRNEWGDPTSDISRETHNYMYAKIERLYGIIDAVNNKKFTDNYREADSLKKIPLMIFYFDRKAQFFTNNALTEEGERLRDKKRKITQRDINISRYYEITKWLQLIKDRMLYQVQFRQWEYTHKETYLKVEATRQYLLLNFLERVMFNKIRTYQFDCNNYTTQYYVIVRNNFIRGSGSSVLDALINNGKEKDALWFDYHNKNSLSGYFFKLILKKYCSFDVLGELTYNSKFYEKRFISENGTYGDYIKILNKGSEK